MKISKRDANADEVYALREELRETGEYFISNEIVSIRKRRGYGPACSWPALIERYIKLEAWLELRLGITTEGKIEKYIAIIECLPQWNVEVGLGPALLRKDIHASNSQSNVLDAARRAKADRDDLVFINSVEFMNDPKKLKLRPLPSVIWLKAIDAANGPLIDVLEPASSGTLEVSPTAADDGEHRNTVDRRPSEAPGKVIKRASETVGTVTDGEA